MKRNFPPFHVSVNADGLVSLWDTEKSAQHVRGEIYVRLELTVEQVGALEHALELAQRRTTKRKK